MIFKELFINVFFSWEGYKSQQRKSPCNMVPACSGENPWMFYKLANEHLSLSLITFLFHFFRLVVVVVHAMAVMSSSGCQKGSACSCGGSPPEPVTLLVSMAVLQAAPQAGCVQGPIQPVFPAAAPLMFSPGAGVKLPSAERERERDTTLQPFSLSQFCAALRGDAKLI